MNRILIFLSILVLLLFAAGCQTDRVTEPDAISPVADVGIDTRLAAAELVRATGWELDAEAEAIPAADKSLPCYLIDIEREVLVDDIVHYSFQLQVGPEPYGVIGLHRVVRERSPNHPIRARRSLFMLHGAGVGFVNSFMTSTRLEYIPTENCLPIFMAQNDIDVWGIDMAWTFIPGDVTDFTFAIDWGLQREVDDLRAGIGIARWVRLLTGNGWRKLDLLGWSMGDGKGYAYLNEESQLPPGHRHVKGFIPVDGPIKNDSEAFIAHRCAGYAATQAARDAGIYVDDQGALAQFAAYLADTDPEGDSPIFPGFTNLGVILTVLTQTSLVFGGDPATYHTMAGVFDETFTPIGLRFADTQFGIDFFASWVPYQPNLIFQDLDGMACDEVDVVYDDHFQDITVPIFYVAPRGGNGAYGEYLATQVGSSDFQSLIVSVDPEAQLDIGHADIFAGYIGVDLPTLVWQPILDWMLEHRANEQESPGGLAIVD